VLIGKSKPRRSIGEIRRELERERAEYDRRRAAPNSPSNWEACNEVAGVVRHLEEELTEAERAEEQRRERPVRWSVAWSAVAALTSAVAALAAWRTVWTSADAFRLDQRPWVQVRVELDGDPGGTAPLEYRVFSVNTGKTPALDATLSVGLAAFPEEPRNVRSEGAGTPTAMFPGAQEKHVDGARGPLPEDGATAYREGRLSVYLVTRTKYSDVFGRQHWTETCHHRNRDTPPGVLFACSKGNRVDF
jgi:hypothetical protein